MKKIENILGDSIGFVELQDSMGGDTQVVNSARVSYGKQVETLEDKDKRLIQRLVSDNHVSVLRSTVMTFRVKCPMAIRNQWMRHVIGCAYASDQLGFNEISRRYTSQDIEFYFPTQFRRQDPENKQASKPLTAFDEDDAELFESLSDAWKDQATDSLMLYNDLIRAGVAREQSRMVLPQCLYTEFLWTASLQAVLHFLDLRDKPEAQWEIAVYAQAVQQLAATVAPETMRIWEANKEGSL